MKKDVNKAYALPVGAEQQSWGWLTLPNIPAGFIKPVSALDRFPSLLQPIKMANGFHLLKVLGKKQLREPLVFAQARQILWSQEMNKHIEQWLGEQRKAAYIKTVRVLKH